MQLFRSIRSAAAMFILGLVLAISASAQEELTHSDHQEPDLPCSELKVPAGHKFVRRVYAVGVQVYKWNGATWDFVAPIANLYDDPDFHDYVGSHYAGPTWETRNGGNVVAARVNGCTADTTAVPWLLLKAVSNDGPGIFNHVSYIQRLRTAGGNPPQLPGAAIGDVARVPYTAEYYFYRSSRR